MTKRAIIFFLLGFLCGQVHAQVLPRCGTHFSFGIPEGPDNLSDPIAGSGISDIFVNIVSEHDGKGIITSPSGYCQEFSFAANTVLKLDIPYNLMHLHDVGKTNKGVLIRTSQPANVTFHDFLSDAGEATQIYPDEALDTNYRITSWGIYDDPGEDNHSEFIITAAHDTTNVTIIPSINTLGNHPANIPIHISLNRGECYIVKADINDLPFATSLSKSIVTSTKPVSIITAISCGYNPLGVESCNEILDEILPRRITDTIFYVAPILGPNATNTVLFTSETQSFWVTSSGNIPYLASNGRVQIDISSPDVFFVSVPAQCFLLTQGSWVSDEGDPSMVTILPPSQYTDTMLWYTPNFTGQVRFQASPFLNFISVLYPTASESQVLLDGIPIKTLSSPQAITSSPMSGTIASLQPGIHRLISPVPIFAITGGFADADGYSFIPGTTAPKLRVDTIAASINISATTAQTCRNFDAAVNAVFRAADGVSTVEVTITYDSKLLTLLSIILGPAAQGGQWTIDSRIPGIITLSASCLAPFSDSGAIALMTFGAGPKVTTTTISSTLNEMGGKELFTALEGTTKKDIPILEVRDTVPFQFWMNGGTSTYGDTVGAVVNIETYSNTITNVPISEIDVFLDYDHDVLALVSETLDKDIVAPGNVSKPISINSRTDEIRITFPTSAIINFPPGSHLLDLIFTSFVAPSDTFFSGQVRHELISFHASVMNTRPCPLDVVDAKFNPVGFLELKDTCGTNTIRELMQNVPLELVSIKPNPSGGSFIVDIDRHVFMGEPVHLSLFDMLGNEVWNTDYLSSSINQRISCAIPASVSTGSYFLRASIIGSTKSQKVLIQK